MYKIVKETILTDCFDPSEKLEGHSEPKKLKVGEVLDVLEGPLKEDGGIGGRGAAAARSACDSAAIASMCQGRVALSLSLSLGSSMALVMLPPHRVRTRLPDWLSGHASWRAGMYRNAGLLPNESFCLLPFVMGFRSSRPLRDRCVSCARA